MPSPPPESKKLERDEDPMVPLSSISAAVFMPAVEDRISEPGAILRGDDDDERVGWEEWRTRGPLPAAWACMAQSAAANAGAKTVPTCAHGLSARTGMESSFIPGILSWGARTIELMLQQSIRGCLPGLG